MNKRKRLTLTLGFAFIAGGGSAVLATPSLAAVPTPGLCPDQQCDPSDWSCPTQQHKECSGGPSSGWDVVGSIYACVFMGSLGPCCSTASCHTGPGG